MIIIRTEDLKDCCSKILFAVDMSELSTITDTLELITKDKVLYLRVTNRDYFAQVKLSIDTDEEFHATVGANLFLKLITQTTSETITLNVTNQTLIVKGNGTYKLPLVFDGDELLKLPEIVINNVTTTFDMDSSILNSIANYNMKEINRGVIQKDIQSKFLLDNKGCITFTDGACVNNFTLPSPVRVLLNQKLVKLFKLFKEGTVKFTLGYDPLNDDMTQTKVKFENNLVSITSILYCDDSLLTQFPDTAVRELADTTYDYSVTISKDELIQTLNRLLLFGKENITNKICGKFSFNMDNLKISDMSEENTESIFYDSQDLVMESPYEALFDLKNFKSTLENCVDSYITISFGNHKSIVVTRTNIKNVIPECSIMS